MHKAAERLCYLFSFILLATGCASIDQRGDPAPVSDVNSRFSGDLNLAQAISSMERGRLNNVESSLKRILSSDTDNRTATRLLEQIQQTAQERYGKEFFTYTVKEGESLGLLAKRFLGHSLEFWGLAKYNDIENPLSLKTGQSLKIPKAKDFSVSSQQQNVLKVDSSVREINALISAKQFNEALERLAVSTEPSVFQAKQYSVQIQQAISGLEQQSDDIKEKEIISNLLTDLITKSKNPMFKEEVTRWLTRLDLPKLRKEANQALANNDLDSAYKAAFVLNSMETKTLSDNNLIEQISEYLHKRAVVYYRNQELERAIHIWDRVLTINPNHEPARVYRKRASKLNSQLQQID
ncbi:MAG: LysM peptidoglycan-binding domain-containing protein [Gammaproteobacteria bacterium]|nr:LysM peptidoglycan-binding domain-containing protein [Gammaproteobacteria bacterium]